MERKDTMNNTSERQRAREGEREASLFVLCEPLIMLSCNVHRDAGVVMRDESQFVQYFSRLVTQVQVSSHINPE